MIFILLIFLDTCGVKSSVEKVSKRQDKIEKTLDTTNTILSQKISSEKIELLLQLNSLETAKEVAYSCNTIFRTEKRPDDLMAKYDFQIKAVLEKLKTVK